MNAERLVYQAILGSLVAAGILPACAGSTAATDAEPNSLLPSRKAPPAETADTRAAPPTEPGPREVCAPQLVARVWTLVCSTRAGDVPVSSKRACQNDEGCDRGETCAPSASGPEATQICWRQVRHEGEACEHTDDCWSELHCVVAAGERTGSCERTCGASCQPTTVCVPTVSSVMTYPNDDVGQKPTREPGPFRCLPERATVFARQSEDPCRDPGESCRVEDATWVCDVTRHTDGFRCGRPLLVQSASGEAEPRTAMPRGEAPRREALTARVRAIAYDEHASIVAFSRMVTALAALGAPLDLLRSTARALADEIEHAELAFELLDHLDPDRRGERPGRFADALAPLPPLDRLRAELVADTVRGGCVGETASAIDAHERARDGGSERARAFFERIAVDETRHAALAFETLAWLAGNDAELWALADATADDPGGTSSSLSSSVASPILRRMQAS